MVHISTLTKRNAYLAPILIGILSAAPSGNALAFYSGPCGAELNAVQDAIDAAIFLGRNAADDKSNLETKLSAANAKIVQNKYDDAIDKLLDISDKATELATEPKKKLEGASIINMKVNDAISCVGGL